MKTLTMLLLGLLATAGVEATVQTEVVEYRDDDTVLEGFLAWDDAVEGVRPGVLVVHDWMGISGETRRRCEMLAKLGYVAFAADIYGKGVRPSSASEAGAQAGKYKGDRALYRRRLAAGLARMTEDPHVDRSRRAAIGYCFGGTGVLELARSGADIQGVVSFHGGLDSLHPEDAQKILAKVLVLHGADDPHVPEADVRAFHAELRAADIDWQMVSYGGAVHAFTNPGAGNDPSRGAAYDARADARSWRAMQDFFGEIFTTGPREP
jgi:dienelactone hydrolase